MNDHAVDDSADEVSHELGFLRSVLSSSTDCIKILDLDAKIRFISACGQTMLEVGDINEVLGTLWYEVWEGDARSEAINAVAAGRAGGVGRFVASGKTLAGTQKWWDVRVSAILDPAGVPERLLCVSTDITERQKGIKALEISEARLVTALQASGVVGLWNWDIGTGVIHGDVNFQRIYELTPEQAQTGMAFDDLFPKFHPEDRPMLRKQLQQTFAVDLEFSSEYRLITQAGRTRWISARGRVMRDSHGALGQFSGSSLDITDRKLSEIRQAFLLGLSDSLRLLTDATAVLSAVTDALGRHLVCDRVGFARILPNGKHMAFEGGYSPVCAVIRGTFPLTCFGTPHAMRLQNGLTVVCDDATQDANTHTHTRTRTRSEAQSDRPVDDTAPQANASPETVGYSAHWEELSVLAFVVVPQLRSGQLHALLYVHSQVVRVWAPEDIALIAAVAERAWDALERVRAEAAMRDNEKRLSTAVAIASLATFQWDTGSNAVFLSDRGRDIFGFDHVQVLSTDSLFSRMHPHDVVRLQTEAAQAARDASGLESIFRVVRPDSSVRWVRSVSDALTAVLGQAVQRVGVYEDVTERMTADQLLRTSELQFRTLAQSLPHQVWTAQPQGRLDWLNARGCEYFDESTEALFATNFAGKVHPDDLPEVRRQWREALPHGSPLQYEMRLRRGDGAYRWHTARAEPLRDESGQVTRWVGTSTDVEEQHLLREALRHTNSSLQARVESQARDIDRAWKNSVDLQVVIGVDGIIRAANDAWFTVLGWQPNEVVGDSYLRFISTQERRSDDEAQPIGLVAALSPYENRMRHAGGGFRWVAWAMAPEGDLIYASGRHITAEKQAAADLQNTQAQLRQSQKMEAVGQLTGGVAHDFNNLLQVISANLQLMVKHAAGNDKLLSRLNSAEGAVRRGARLASQLLAFSRQQTLEPVVVDVGRFVQRMEDMVRRGIGEAIEISTVVALGSWNAMLDLAQLENALLNLAINARDAMKANAGRVCKLTMAVSNVTATSPSGLRHTDLAAGEYVKLAVNDTGAGMSQAVIGQIFEPFFSTKPVGSGTGLGLSMVYGFVKQSGGHIEVESELGKGSTLTLFFPRCEQAEQKPSTSDTDSGPLTGGSESILVAEDDEGVRTTLVELLTELGYRVLQADSADRAFEVIQSGVTIDLLLTDVVMPGRLKSVDLVRMARQHLPQLCVLYTSGYALNVIASADRLASDVDLLPKPYTREILARKLRQVFNKGSTFTTAV